MKLNVRLLVVLLVPLVACPPRRDTGLDTGTPDLDGDGWDIGRDCNDGDAAVHPGVAEIWYDGVDGDCGGDEDFDADGDGFVPGEYLGRTTTGILPSGGLPGGDCWDDPTVSTPDTEVIRGQDVRGGDLAWRQPAPSEVHPGAAETWYDGVDEDCDGTDDADQDGDGFRTDDYPHRGLDGALVFGDDCLDDPRHGVGLDEPNPAGSDPAEVHPGAAETWYDGTDQDCDGIDCDADGDGFEHAGSAWCGTGDCDDTQALRYPGNPELDDGLDNDCDDLVDEGFLAPGGLVITELALDPAGTGTAEPQNTWFEIYNPSLTRTVVLDGLEVASDAAGGASFRIAPGGLAVGPATYAVICAAPDLAPVAAACGYRWLDDGNGASSAGPTWSPRMRLDPVSGTLALAMEGTVIDAVAYTAGVDWPTGTDGRTWELSRTRLDAVANDLGTNWCEATSLLSGADYGTPGAENTCAR